MEIVITVSGPGECINNEMLIIEEALKDALYPVKVINDHPPKSWTITNASRGTKVTLIADHQPWGG